MLGVIIGDIVGSRYEQLEIFRLEREQCEKRNQKLHQVINSGNPRIVGIPATP